MNSLVDYLLEKFNNGHHGDEFYTRLKDIEKELSKFNFNNKIVYCNCDNPEFSNFYKYFYDNFNKLGLKKLLATYYSDNPMLYSYDGKNESKTNIKSGDFRENGDVMKQCDIVVTNPPFSKGLPIDLVNMCLKYNKDFIFLCKNDWYTRKGAFDFYKSGKMNIDNVEVGKFEGPNASTKVTCYWYTSFELKKTPITLKKKYTEEDYQKYKNYDAIEVGAIENIPKDYNDNMGVSLSFGKYLDRKQFDIIDVLNKPIGKDGHEYYKRIIIKKASS